MNKIELESLAVIRIKEAQVLLNAGCFHGAYYLAGYAVECTLKACIAKRVREFDFPDKKLANDSYTHKLTDLLKVAGLNQYLSQKENTDSNFERNWATVKDWSEESRYNCFISQREAEDLFEAITESQSGILSWLQNYL